MAKKATLQAVNTLLSNIGQSPVTSLEFPNPMVDLAEQVLEEVSRSVQSEGWVFNSEYQYPFTPDVNGQILIPDNLLSLDTDRLNSRIDPVIRGGKLYDKRNHTYKFTNDQKLNVIWMFDFEDLPEVFRSYIAIRAANLFAARATGSAEIVKYSEREEAALRAAVMEYETQQGDYNMLSTPDGRNIVRGYQPIDTVYRY